MINKSETFDELDDAFGSNKLCNWRRAQYQRNQIDAA